MIDPQNGKPKVDNESDFGHCQKCFRKWCYVSGHGTQYQLAGGGCFPLCEDCWQNMTIGERLPCYMQLCDEWEAYESRDVLYSLRALQSDRRNAIHQAVVKELSKADLAFRRSKP